MKTIHVMTKGNKYNEATLSDYIVNMVGNWIEIDDIKLNIQNEFKVGDICTYDSYNLIYTGLIEKITDKTVTVVAYKGTYNEFRKRLSLYEFCWRNIKFNVEECAKHNTEESYCI